MPARVERATRQDLAPLLHAESVAIVGISKPERFGGTLYQNLVAARYPGRIYGVGFSMGGGCALNFAAR